MKDPAFLFYPGDYLRDTQCLSEPVQVSYDRIMCEHMRNICISKSRLDFFTKKLSDTEKEELNSVLTVVDGGFQITWVAESIIKRKAYSSSRRSNRSGKNKKDMLNICESYDLHMENENVNENSNSLSIKKDEIFSFDFLEKSPLKLVFMNWFYFKQKTKPFKTQESLEASFVTLENFSGKSVFKANEIVTYNIEAESKNLFLKEDKKPAGKVNETWNNKIKEQEDLNEQESELWNELAK